MRSKTSGLVLGTLAAACALTAVPANPHHGLTPEAKAQESGGEQREPCSVRSLRGRYGLTFQGFGTTGPVPAVIDAYIPAAGVGVMNFDGSGNLTLSETLSFGGKVAPLVTTGTYTVEPDCTGSLIAPHAALWNFVIVHDGKQILAINTIQGRVATVNLEKQ